MKKINFRSFFTFIFLFSLLFSINAFSQGESNGDDNLDFLSNVYLERGRNVKLEDYQALYASQAKGVFFVVFGKFSTSGEYIDKIEFISLNYSKPKLRIFTRKNIGFLDSKIDTSNFHLKDSTLFFSLNLKKRVKGSCRVRDSIDYYKDRVKYSSCYTSVDFTKSSKRYKVVDIKNIHIFGRPFRNKKHLKKRIETLKKQLPVDVDPILREKALIANFLHSKEAGTVGTTAFTRNCDESFLNVVIK